MFDIIPRRDISIIFLFFKVLGSSRKITLITKWQKKKNKTQTVFTSKISMLGKLTDLMRGFKIISTGMN